jgi:hypothetical protein
MVDGGLGNTFEPQIAIDANGNALAVWGQASNATGTPQRLDLWSSRLE